MAAACGLRETDFGNARANGPRRVSNFPFSGNTHNLSHGRVFLFLPCAALVKGSYFAAFS
jgi:hypothetical protein